MKRPYLRSRSTLEIRIETQIARIIADLFCDNLRNLRLISKCLRSSRCWPDSFQNFIGNRRLFMRCTGGGPFTRHVIEIIWFAVAAPEVESHRPGDWCGDWWWFQCGQPTRE